MTISIANTLTIEGPETALQEVEKTLLRYSKLPSPVALIELMKSEGLSCSRILELWEAQGPIVELKLGRNLAIQPSNVVILKKTSGRLEVSFETERPLPSSVAGQLESEFTAVGVSVTSTSLLSRKIHVSLPSGDSNGVTSSFSNAYQEFL